VDLLAQPHDASLPMTASFSGEPAALSPSTAGSPTTLGFFVEELNKLTESVSFPNPTTSVALEIEYLTYTITVKLFEDRAIRQLFSPGLALLLDLCTQFKGLLKTHLPVLADHFDEIGLDSQHIVLAWFQTLFV
jgi:hypothetical protein